MDMTKEFENASFDFSNQNMFVRWENQTLSASFLQTCEFIFILLMSTAIMIVNEKKGLNKQEAYGPHCAPEQQFVISLYFIF